MNLRPQPSVPGYAALLHALEENDASRISFIRACLAKLGLPVADEPCAIPSLSNMHLSGLDPSSVAEMLADWEEIIEREEGEEYIRAEADTFMLEKRESRWDGPRGGNGGEEEEQGIVDYGKVVKRIVPHEEAWPDVKETPSFQHNAFYSSLREFRAVDRAETWGDQLMYGEVLTSTNTVLEKYAPLPCPQQRDRGLTTSGTPNSSPSYPQVSPSSQQPKSQAAAAVQTSGSPPRVASSCPPSSTTPPISPPRGPSSLSSTLPPLRAWRPSRGTGRGVGVCLCG